MDDCWRCASKLIPGSRFCPGCGAAIGSASGERKDRAGAPATSKPIEREPADPLAATAPADAGHLAALRRGAGAAKKGRSQETTPPKTKGRTVPMKATPLVAPAQARPAASPPRRVAKTQTDEPTMPSHGERPRTSPKASSTFGDQTPPPVSPYLQPPYLPPPQAASPYLPPPAVGAKVLVAWTDGNRYPATVQQCAPGQCLVLFPDGQQRWVDVRRVTGA
jgi:hypothetical protein